MTSQTREKIITIQILPKYLKKYRQSSNEIWLVKKIKREKYFSLKVM